MSAAQVGQQAAAARRRIAGERATTRHASPTGVSAAKEPIRRRWVVPNWLLAGIVVVAAAVLTVDLVAWARSASSGADVTPTGPSALTAAPAQAEKAAEQILSYDYATLRQDTAAATAYMSPAYAQTFQRTVDDLLASPATAARGEVAARVMASGVVSAGTTAVKVLLFVDQTSTTKTSPKPRTALNRVEFTMVLDDGRWLVDDVTAL